MVRFIDIWIWWQFHASQWKHATSFSWFPPFVKHCFLISSLSDPSVTLSTLLFEFLETQLLLSEHLWLILSHKQKEKVSQPKAEFVFIIIIKDHQTLKKSQTFPFIDSSTSILCSIKANNHIFPATFIPCFSTPPKPNMLDGPGRGRAKSTEANWVQKEASGSMHRHNPVMCYKTPFPIFFIGKFLFGKDSLCRICDFSFRCKFSFDYDVKCDVFM